MVRQSLNLRFTRWRGIAIAAALLLMMALPALNDPDNQPSSLASDVPDVSPPRAVAPGQIEASPGSLAFFGVVGGQNPPALSLAVTSTSEQVNWQASAPDAAWLRFEPARSGTPASLQVRVDLDGLASGRYQTDIVLTPGDIRVPVTLELFEPVSRARLEISPATLSFVAVAGEGAPQAKRLELARPGGGEAGWAAVTSAPWLRLSAYSGTTPEEIDVAVDPRGMEPGAYSGAIWAGQRSIPVTLMVLEPPIRAEAETSSTAEARPTAEATPAPNDPGEAGLSVDPAAISIAAIAGGPGAGDREIEISSLSGAPMVWSVTASETWLRVDSSAGATPTTVKITADISGLAPGTHRASLQIGEVSVPVEVTVLEQAPPDVEFEETWTYQDQPVEDAFAPRTWLWGPASNGTTYEEFVDSPGGMRLVQYHDKARMEITYPEADRESDWYVTNGLLARELITGRLQLGETTFEAHDPASIPVAGDAGDERGPRYSSFTGLLDAPALPAGSVVVQTVDTAGNVGEDPAFAAYNVTVTAPDATTGHSIAQVFWDYLSSTGTVQGEFGYVTGPLFEPWFYATGLPITEPYWAVVAVGGTPHDVLIQCFERRCLTYTPDNQPPWQVEQGNVGLHYFRWRYEQIERE